MPAPRVVFEFRDSSVHHDRGFAVRPSDEPLDDDPAEDDPLGDDEGRGAGGGGSELRLGRSCAVAPVEDPPGWV